MIGGRCPIGSYKKNDTCVPIHRCPNGTHRTCQSIDTLKENMQRVKARAEDNELLKHVIADYEELYKKLQTQKETQQVQMKRILEHLQKIRQDNFLSDTGLRHLEHEQTELLTKLKGIQDSVHALAK
jgi:ABC-type phosphate transport system auxiliary subunit